MSTRRIMLGRAKTRSEPGQTRTRSGGAWRINAPAPWARALKGLIFLAICAVVIVPFLGIVSTSLATRDQIIRSGGFVLWPEDASLAAYQSILSGGVVTRAVGVSAFITICGTALSLTCTTLLAYGLSRAGSFAHKPLLMMVLGGMLFVPGIIPSYLVVKGLGLLDSYWSLILPTSINAFNVIVMRGFFMEMPQEVLESARVDGASDPHILWRIVLPLSKAPLAVIGLFYGVGYWNAFFAALLYMSDTAKWPLQLVLRTYVVNQTQMGVDQLGSASGAALPPQEAIQMAILVISIVPILAVYPFVQRHFTKGVMIGAVKG